MRDEGNPKKETNISKSHPNVTLTVSDLRVKAMSIKPSVVTEIQDKDRWQSKLHQKLKQHAN